MSIPSFVCLPSPIASLPQNAVQDFQTASLFGTNKSQTIMPLTHNNYTFNSTAHAEQDTQKLNQFNKFYTEVTSERHKKGIFENNTSTDLHHYEESPAFGGYQQKQQGNILKQQNILPPQHKRSITQHEPPRKHDFLNPKKIQQDTPPFYQNMIPESSHSTLNKINDSSRNSFQQQYQTFLHQQDNRKEANGSQKVLNDSFSQMDQAVDSIQKLLEPSQSHKQYQQIDLPEKHQKKDDRGSQTITYKYQHQDGEIQNKDQRRPSNNAQKQQQTQEPSSNLKKITNIAPKQKEQDPDQMECRIQQNPPYKQESQINHKKEDRRQSSQVYQKPYEQESNNKETSIEDPQIKKQLEHRRYTEQPHSKIYHDNYPTYYPHSIHNSAAQSKQESKGSLDSQQSIQKIHEDSQKDSSDLPRFNADNSEQDQFKQRQRAYTMMPTLFEKQKSNKEAPLQMNFESQSIDSMEQSKKVQKQKKNSKDQIVLELVKQLEDLNLQLKQKDQTIKQLRSDVQGLAEENSDLKQQIQKSNDSFDRSESEKRSQHRDYYQDQKIILQLENENQELKQTVDQQQQQIEQIGEELMEKEVNVQEVIYSCKKNWNFFSNRKQTNS